MDDLSRSDIGVHVTALSIRWIAAPAYGPTVNFTEYVTDAAVEECVDCQCGYKEEETFGTEGNDGREIEFG